MTEDQADRIISLLEDISSQLSTIELSTSDLSSVESNTDDTVRILKRIQNQLR